MHSTAQSSTVQHSSTALSRLHYSTVCTVCKRPSSVSALMVRKRTALAMPADIAARCTREKVALRPQHSPTVKDRSSCRDTPAARVLYLQVSGTVSTVTDCTVLHRASPDCSGAAVHEQGHYPVGRRARAAKRCASGRRARMLRTS